MITLQQPLTIVTSSITIPVNPHYYIMDNSNNKTVSAIFKGLHKPLILWQGQDYDSIGNWTEAQADAKILELLGNNPEELFKSLIVIR
jgi:hypothetical protein